MKIENNKVVEPTSKEITYSMVEDLMVYHTLVDLANAFVDYRDQMKVLNFAMQIQIMTLLKEYSK